MALHLRSLKLKSGNFSYSLTRCFVAQVQSLSNGDKRSVGEVDWEALAGQVSLLCEEAKRHVSALPLTPAASSLALLVLESQKLVDAVNKHVLVTSPCLGSGHRSALDLLDNGKAMSWCKVKGQSLLQNELDQSAESNKSAVASTTDLISADSVDGFGSFTQPYSYTSDDIIIRGGALRDSQYWVENSSSLSSRSRSCVKPGINSDLFSNGEVYCAIPSNEETPGPQTGPPAPMKGGPDPHRLELLKDHLIKTLPKFFVSRQDYRIYHQEIIFENNYYGTNIVSKGLNAYATQLNKYRVLALLKFAHVEFKVLSATAHPEDGTVRLRWRIKGLSQFKALMFWKFLPWTYKKSVKEESQWYDGFSVFTLNKDGYVVKHRIDRVMPDEETEVAKSSNLALKLSVLLGLVPKPGLHDFASLFFKKTPPSSVSGNQ